MKHIKHENFSISICGTKFNRLKNKNTFEIFNIEDFKKQYELFPKYCCSKCINVLKSLKEQNDIRK